MTDLYRQKDAESLLHFLKSYAVSAGDGAQVQTDVVNVCLVFSHARPGALIESSMFTLFVKDKLSEQMLAQGGAHKPSLHQSSLDQALMKIGHVCFVPVMKGEKYGFTIVANTQLTRKLNLLQHVAPVDNLKAIVNILRDNKANATKEAAQVLGPFLGYPCGTEGFPCHGNVYVFVRAELQGTGNTRPLSLFTFCCPAKDRDKDFLNTYTRRLQAHTHLALKALQWLSEELEWLGMIDISLVRIVLHKVAS